MKPEKLMELAEKARENAYAPYSNFKVGAALLCDDGTVYTGCNMENAAYSPTLCAERVAFAKAVSEGQRTFVAMALCGGKNGKIEGLCTPCGVCRQVMAEFCKKDFSVYVADTDGFATFTLEDLLPNGFSL